MAIASLVAGPTADDLKGGSDANANYGIVYDPMNGSLFL
jgi:hypothetical protein